MNKFIIYIGAYSVSLGLAFLFGRSNPCFLDESVEPVVNEENMKCKSEMIENINFSFNRIMPQNFCENFNPERQRGLEALANTSNTRIFVFRLNELLKGLSLEDFPRFLAEVNMIFDSSNKKNTVIIATLVAWADQDLFQALDAIHQLKEENRPLWLEGMGAVAPEWAEKHPHHAMEWFFENIKNAKMPTELLASALFEKNMQMFVNTLVANKGLLSPLEQTSILYMATYKDYNSLESLAPVITLFDNFEIVHGYEERSIAQNIARDIYFIDETAAIEWVASLTNEMVKIGAFTNIADMMEADELLNAYDRVRYWELSGSGLQKVTANVLRNLVSEDYDTAKTFYLANKGQPEIEESLGSLVSNINLNDFEAEKTSEEIAFWLNEVTDVSDRNSLARSFLFNLDENRVDFEQLKALLTPYILESTTK